MYENVEFVRLSDDREVRVAEPTWKQKRDAEQRFRDKNKLHKHAKIDVADEAYVIEMLCECTRMTEDELDDLPFTDVMKLMRAMTKVFTRGMEANEEKKK